jgi:hypothetical protein
MTTSTVQPTPYVRAVLDVIAAAGRPMYGSEISRAAGVKAIPVLNRLQRAGMVDSTKEDRNTALRAGRVARRYFQLTGDGATWWDDINDNTDAQDSSISSAA